MIDVQSLRSKLESLQTQLDVCMQKKKDLRDASGKELSDAESSLRNVDGTHKSLSNRLQAIVKSHSR